MSSDARARKTRRGVPGAAVRLSCSIALCGIALCSIALCGCDETVDETRLPVHPARGTVLVKGVPAPGIHVVLHPQSGSEGDAAQAIPSARTAGDGTFQLSTYDQNDGAPPGAYAVTLQWYQEGSPKAAGPGRVSGFAPPVDSFHGKFRDPKTSPWQVTITEGENVLAPIDVE